MNSKSKLLAPELVNAERPVWAFSKKIFCEGMRDGVPIALGYFAVSFSLGIAARRAGFTPFQGFLVSLLNNASAGEYAAFAIIMANATYLEVAIITLIANARYLLMSCALAQRFAPGTPFWHRLLIGYDVTDVAFWHHHCTARQPEPILYLRCHSAGGTGLGHRYSVGHHCGQSAAAAGCQCAERCPLRHVPCHHHSSSA